MFSYFIKYHKNYFTIVLSILVSIVLVALSVVPFYVSAGYHDTQRLISTVSFALALCLVIRYAQVSRQTMWLLGVAHVWGLFAVYMSPLPLWSMLEFGLLYSVVLLGVTLIPKLQRVHLTYLAILIAAIHGYYAAHNLIDYGFTLVLSRAFDPYALSSGFSNVRFYGQFLVWTMPFLVGVLATNPKLPYRPVLVILLIFDWAFEFLALTRAFLVAMAVTLPMIFWFTKSYWLLYAKWLLFTAAGGFAMYVLMLHVLPGLLGVDVSYAIQFSSGRDMFDSSGRLQLWLDALLLMLNHPWLGAGPMMTALDSVSQIAAHPHNYVLQLLAEWGIPFTLLVHGGALVGVNKLRKLIQNAPTDSALLALPITASLSAGSVAGLFDGLLVMPVSLVYMSLILACCAGLWRNLTPEVQRCNFSCWAIPVLIVPSLFVAAFSIINWPYSASNTPASVPMSGNGYQLLTKFNPRFWWTGHISLDKADR
jgi:putative inorganic carbon (hco3(-)) transporter